MTQVRDLAEPQKLQLEDADTLVSDLICEGLNDAMRARTMPVTDGEYSTETRVLLRRAWTIAAQLQHREVVADHIIIGMVTGDESVGAPSLNKFADAGVDLGILRTRTLARLAGLPTALDDLSVPVQPVANDVLSWICEAMRIARAGDEERREFVPDDLVQVVLNARQPDHPLHNPLQDVVDRFGLGEQPEPAEPGSITSPGRLVPVERDPSAQPSDAIGTREHLPGVREAIVAIRSAQHTASRGRTAVVRLTKALAGIPADSGAEPYVEQLRTRVSDLQSQLTDVVRRTAEIKDTQLAGLAKDVGDCRSQLDAIKAGLPRPPATRWVALAITIVLVIGSAAGIALRDPSISVAVDKLARTYVVN
jgi:hypothetical protein